MICSELQLETVFGGLAMRRLHDAGVVDQDVNRPTFGQKVDTQRLHACQRGEVEALERQVGIRNRGADALHRSVPFGLIADRQDHVRARGR